MAHALDPIPDPQPATTLIQSSTRVVGADEAQKEALATALKACLALVEFADGMTVLASRQEVLQEAVVYARKAVQLGSKLE